jgi:endonuclease YncB( thermonuclease family)
VDKVTDGDSVYLDIDLGFGHVIMAHNPFTGKPELECRLQTADGNPINAPEKSTPEGKAALAFAQTLLKPGDRCKTTSYGWDKYGGRYDGSITLADGRDFGQTMVDTGHAVIKKY